MAHYIALKTITPNTSFMPIIHNYCKQPTTNNLRYYGIILNLYLLLNAPNITIALYDLILFYRTNTYYFQPLNTIILFGAAGIIKLLPFYFAPVDTYLFKIR